MKIRTVYRIMTVIFLVIISGASLFAGGWTDMVPQIQNEWINDMVSYSDGRPLVYAVGDNAFCAFSDNDGFGWSTIPIPSSNRIEAVDIHYGAVDTTVFAVGEAGSVFRIRQNSLFDENTPIPENFHTVEVEGDRIWIGGDNGQLFFSDNAGDSWTPASINGQPVNITSLISTTYGMYACGFWDTTSYILSDENNDTVFDVVDSLDNVVFMNSFADFGRLYFAGENLIDGRAAIGFMDDILTTYGTLLPNFPIEIEAPISGISGTFESFEKIWVTAANGQIYQSDRDVINFFPVYQNMEVKSLHTIELLNGSIPPVFLAAGSDGLLVRYDFMVIDMFPFMNDFFFPAENAFSIQFTNQTDYQSVQDGIFIHSSVQGLRPFLIDFDPGDSTKVDVSIQDGGTVPGENLTIILSDIIQDYATNAPFDKTFNYQLSTVSGGGQNFLNTAPTPVYSAATVTANFVTGFFNEDDIFDLVTVSESNIFFFAGTGSGELLSPEIYPLIANITIDGSIPEQIKSMDINLDGLLDLIVFDNDEIQTYIKEPDAAPNLFIPGPTHFSNNLHDIALFSIDQDAHLDLAILNDSLRFQTQIDQISFGLPVYGEPLGDWLDIEISDIDADAFPDFAALTLSGDIVLRHMVAWQGFDQETTITGPFDNFLLADIDDDRQMEVLAQQNDIIRVFHKDPDWQFSEMTAITQTNPEFITSFVAHDFNNDRWLDVVLTNAGKKFKVFQNIGAAFSERLDVERIIQVEPSGLVYGDFDMDATLDLAAYDRLTGDVEVLRNLPGPGPIQNEANFDSVYVTGNAVYLEWPEFQPLDALSFYNIFRGPDTLSMTPISTGFTNFYIDSTVSPGSLYWYRVEAIDTAAAVYPITGNLEIVIPYELAGVLSGVLSDTISPYIVTAPIEVPQDSSLLITEGVEILFEPGMDFTVYGSLEVTGSEDQFVEFRALNFDQPWAGITISGIVTTDTVHLTWFDIGGAFEGMRIENRPVNLKFGGIFENQIAFNVVSPNSFLKAENVLVDHNEIGIQSSNSSVVHLKNVTIAGNRQLGMDIYDNAQVSVKNSIVYLNNKDDIFNDFKKGPDIRNQSTIDMNLSYSTIDSIEGNYNGLALNPLKPIFQNLVKDSMDFIPDTMSSTIDFGDPLDDFSDEPLPNGGRINQGVYGGSPFAMPTYQPRIMVKIDTLFLSAFPGETQSGDLVVYNTGNRTLEIFNLELHIVEFNHSDAVPVFILPGDSANFTLDFLPSDRQVYTDEIYIRCNDPHFPPEGLKIPIRGTGLNRPPQITNISLLNAVQDIAYVDTIRATDPDNDKLTFAAIVIPEWLKLGPDGALSGTPGNEHIGTNIKIEISVSDEFGANDIFLTYIDVADVNDPPRFTTSALRDAIEDSVYVDSLFADDTDKDSLNFYPIDVPDWMIVEKNGALGGIPRNEDVIDAIRVEVGVSDTFGAGDTLRTQIQVINTNDIPTIVNLQDTVAYAFIPFNYAVTAIDVDGDSLSFFDDSPLFEINAKSGIIEFIPDLPDTGRYTIEIKADDGQLTARDTFQLHIELTPIPAASVPEVTSLDQEIKLRWKNESSAFYNGTRIVWSTLGPVKNPDNAVNYIDTTYVMDTMVEAKIRNLKIAKEYYVTIFNYFDPGSRIYSKPVEIQATTLAPLIDFDFARRVNYVPPGDTLIGFMPIKNAGGGTLNFKFRYLPDNELEKWFSADSTQYTLAPAESMSVSFRMFPDKTMEDMVYDVQMQLWTNQPGNLINNVNLSLNILFDTDAPRAIVLAQPDSLHRYSAVHFEFSAQDTVQNYGWSYGAATKDLRMRYKFNQITTTGVVEIKREDNIPLGDVNIYPLPDGLYHLELWIFDPDGNGLIKTAFEQRLLINASEIPVSRNQWYLTSFPREQDMELSRFVADSTALAFRWDNKNMQYVSLGDSMLKAGQGVWILSFKPRKLDVSGFSVAPSDADSTRLTIAKGWHQIGVPAGYHLNFGDLKYLIPGTNSEIDRDVVFKDYLSPAIYWYQATNTASGYAWSMIDSTIVSPWRGYWVYANKSVTLVYSRKPAFPQGSYRRSSSDAVITNPINLTKRATNVNDWKLTFNVSNDTHYDLGNIVGICDAPAQLPFYEPPHLDEYCSAFFISEAGNITQDLRKPFKDSREVKEWPLQVQTSAAGKPHTLNWPEWHKHNGVYLYVVDNINEQVIDITEKQSYTFTPKSQSHSFSVYATLDASYTPKIIPVSYKLLQNYPNPFNPNTTIRFGIPNSGDNTQVTLKVFNILGQEVVTLFNKKMAAGYHEVQWNGLNQHALPVSSGVYFYRLWGEGVQEVKKMILIR